jgi:hypothetical protein
VSVDRIELQGSGCGHPVLATRFRETPQTIKDVLLLVVLSLPISTDVGNYNWQVVFSAVAKALTWRSPIPAL